jgi:hypothetical protein
MLQSTGTQNQYVAQCVIMLKENEKAHRCVEGGWGGGGVTGCTGSQNWLR